MTELDPRTPRQWSIIETAEGGTIRFFEAGGIRLYKGVGQLRRLAQDFIPGTYRGLYGSGYGQASLEHKLAGLAIVGKTGSYYGLDVEGINAYVRATGGIEMVKEGEELPDTIRVQLASESHVYFPTAALLEKFGVQRRPSAT